MASYNCGDTTENTYGAGGFGTCTGQSIGAPNTGVFEQVLGGGSFTILAPLLAAVILAVVAMLVVHRRLSRRRTKYPNTDQHGFTIVELLVVVVVIGVLAAIVVVAYNGVQTRARDTAVQSDLKGIAKKLEIYKATSTSGLYPADATQLEAADFKVSQGNYSTDRNNVYYCRSADYLQYAIGVEVTTGAQYYLTNGNVAAATGVLWGNTCDQLTPAGNGGAIGYNFTPATGWSAWTQ